MEIEFIDYLIDKMEKRLKKINKNLFLTNDDILDLDNNSNYICIKTNDNTELNIKIIDEDDFQNKNIYINLLGERIKKDYNLNMSLIFNNNINNLQKIA